MRPDEIINKFSKIGIEVSNLTEIDKPDKERKYYLGNTPRGTIEIRINNIENANIPIQYRYNGDKKWKQLII